MTKTLLFSIFTLFCYNIASQELPGRPFITGDLNFTLTLNTNYTLDPDDGETLLIPAAFLLRFGAGYEFKKRIAFSLNAGLDNHWNYDVLAIPTYGALKYNITQQDDDAHFVEVRYGNLWAPSYRFSEGSYFGVGAGFQLASDSRFNIIFRVDYHHKRITGFYKNRLESFSFGFGFSFF